MFWETDHCVLGNGSLCSGKRITVFWETDHCVLGNGSLCSGKRITVFWDGIGRLKFHETTFFDSKL